MNVVIQQSVYLSYSGIMSIMNVKADDEKVGNDLDCFCVHIACSIYEYYRDNIQSLFWGLGRGIANCRAG